MNARKVGLLLLALALLSGSAALKVGPTNAAPESAAFTLSAQSAARAADISAERIARHISFLASDKLQGRRAGTPAADEAARYIAEEFRHYGLKPVSSTGFLQPFSFISGVRLGEQNRFEIKTAGGSRSLKVGQDYMPLAFSSSDPASGPVVFIGYGISAPEFQYDNYASIDVRGKIVLALRGGPDGDNPHSHFADYTAPGLEIQRKTLRAREKGARGIIFVSAEENFHEDSLSRLRHDLNFLDAGITAAVISRQAAQALFASAGKTLTDAEASIKAAASPLSIEGITAEIKTNVVKINGQSANVVGILQGSDPRLASEYVVIGAHYDHLGLGGPESLASRPEGQIHHGADDNASGTAALIELARALSAGGDRPRRSIVFAAFSAEEMGLLGSAAYTKNPPLPLASTVAMLNMDMVGRLRNNSLTVGGVGTSPAWKPLLDKLNMPSQPATAASGDGTRFRMGIGQDGFGPSDHQSFYVRDIPVLFFFTGTHEDYHKPSDVAERINTEGVKRIAEFVREIATSVANENERIAFTRVKTETRGMGRGFRVYLGTVPNYADQGEGMKLDGIRPGSPAERAGLRAGDVVIKLGGVPIKNVYDYTYALGELRAGEEVEVAIRREGREMTLKITPERRQ